MTSRDTTSHIARDTARNVRRIWGQGYVNAEEICAVLGLELLDYPFSWKINGAYCQDVIGINPALSPIHRNHTILHEIGHHLMHRARPQPEIGTAEYRDMEEQAEAFAYWFTSPVTARAWERWQRAHA